MKKYEVEVSNKARTDLESIIAYLKYDLAGDIIAERYAFLFKQGLRELEYIADLMPVLDKNLTGIENIRKVNVRNYVIFYSVAEENGKALVLRVGHAFMDWEKFLKE